MNNSRALYFCLLANFSKEKINFRPNKFQHLGILLLAFTVAGGLSAPVSASICDSPACGAIVIVQTEDARVKFSRATNSRISSLLPGPQDEVRFDELSVPGLADNFPGWVFGGAAQAPAGSVRTSARIRSGDGAAGRVMVTARANNETELRIGGASNGQTVRFSLDLAIDGELDSFGSGLFAGTSFINYSLIPHNVRFVSGTEFASGPSGFITRDASLLTPTFRATAPGTYLSSFNFTFDWVVGTPAPLFNQEMLAETHLNGLVNFFGTGKITAVTLPAGLSLSSDGLNFDEVAPGRFAAIYAPVPIPGAIWFFGTAIFGMIALRRGRK